MSDNNRMLPDLRVLACVVEHASFTGAARTLRTSTAAVSRSIRRLEQAVGAQLVNRTTRRVGLTVVGAELYARSSASLKQLERAIDEARNSRSEPRGLLRVSSSISFGRRFVAPALIDFRMIYPEIDIDLNLSDEFTDLVQSGMDITVRGGLPNDARLIARKIAPLPLYVCASPRFLKRQKHPSQPEDLRGMDCLRFRFRGTGQMHAWEFADQGKTYAIDVPGRFCVDDIDAACEAAIRGLGFAQLPGYVAVEPIRRGELVPLLLDYVDDTRFFAVTYVNRSELQPLRDTLFVDYLLLRLSQPAAFALSPSEIESLGATQRV